MTDYIERDSALRIIIQKQKELCPLGTYGKKYVDGYDREKFDDWQEIIDGIESVPAADVEEVKHGKWVKSSVIKCSVCGSCTDIQSDEAYEKFIESYCYCPVCGSKLDLGD